jgi:hypothetical protein
MSPIVSNGLTCIGCCLFFAFVLWQADKAISFHICAFRSMRTKEDFADAVATLKNPSLVPTKVVPAVIALVGVGIITIVDNSIVGLIIAIAGIVLFCASSAVHAYAALGRSNLR